MAFGVYAGIIGVADNGRRRRAVLRAVALAGEAVQLVIAIADCLGGLLWVRIGSGRGLLQQLAICVVSVGDGARFGVRSREQARQGIVSKCPGAPLRAVRRSGAFLVDAQQIAQRVILVHRYVGGAVNRRRLPIGEAARWACV